MLQNRNALLIIDMQYDFSSSQGALYVQGAEYDVGKTAIFIRKNKKLIDKIFLTLDFHQIIDISHPAFWADSEGNHPQPFTQITWQDIQNNKWKALYETDRAHNYVLRLEQQGEYTHTIWPEHCIMGSHGASIDSTIMNAVTDWAREGKFFEVVIKGTNPLTEHFGAIRANIPIPEDETTLVNTRLLNELRSYKSIYLAGEARSHCVATTVKQLCEYPDLIQNITLLEDCTSPVPGFEHLADRIFEKAFASGMKKSTSEIILTN